MSQIMVLSIYCQLATNWPTLDLRQCEITAETVKGITENGKNLTVIGLSGIKGMCDFFTYYKVVFCFILEQKGYP